MPQVGFFCPDGVSVLHQDCVSRCSMGQRCLTKSSLKFLTQTRGPSHPISVTECIKGTRQAYLERTVPFFIDPIQAAYRILGSRVHLGLEQFDTESSILEERFFDQLGCSISGKPDCYEMEQIILTGGAFDIGILTDYKTSGSFAVARWIGITREYHDSPTGELYKRSGKGYKKGDIKQVSVWVRRTEAIDARDIELQMNAYRLFYESLGFQVDKMQIECIVRDGNTWVARNRGLNLPQYLVHVRRMPDQEVKDYFMAKSRRLEVSLAKAVMPEVCDAWETWKGRRCEAYCDVWFECDVGKEVRNAEEDGQE